MDDFTTQQPRAWIEILDQMVGDPMFVHINHGSPNGPGSSLKFTKGLCKELPTLLRRYQVTTMLDAPCGDWTWARTIDLSFLYSYIGMDVAPDLIKSNKFNVGPYRPNVTFICANLLTRPKFPKVDLILCRDFLSHLTTEYIGIMLDKFKLSGSTYLLASNYPGSSNEFEYIPEAYPWLGYLERTHDLTAEPFNMERIDGITEASAPGGILTNPHELALFEL